MAVVGIVLDEGDIPFNCSTSDSAMVVFPDPDRPQSPRSRGDQTKFVRAAMPADVACRRPGSVAVVIIVRRRRSRSSKRVRRHP